MLWIKYIYTNGMKRPKSTKPDWAMQKIWNGFSGTFESVVPVSIVIVILLFTQNKTMTISSYLFI